MSNSTAYGYSIGFRWEGAMYHGFNQANDPLGMFDIDSDGGLRRLTRREDEENSVYGVAYVCDGSEQQWGQYDGENERAGNQELAGSAIDQYFGNKPRQKYCVDLGDGLHKYMRGEFYSGLVGGIDGKCYDVMML